MKIFKIKSARPMRSMSVDSQTPSVVPVPPLVRSARQAWHVRRTLWVSGVVKDLEHNAGLVYEDNTARRIASLIIEYLSYSFKRRIALVKSHLIKLKNSHKSISWSSNGLAHT